MQVDDNSLRVDESPKRDSTEQNQEKRSDKSLKRNSTEQNPGNRNNIFTNFKN